MRVLASSPRQACSLSPSIFILKLHCVWLLSAMVVCSMCTNWKEVKPNPSTEFWPSVFLGESCKQPGDLEVLVANKKHHKTKKKYGLYQKINFRKLNYEKLIWTSLNDGKLMMGKLIISSVEGVHLQKYNTDNCTGNSQCFKMKISGCCSLIFPNRYSLSD